MVDDLLGSVAMQMVERPWGITAFGAASVKAVPDLVRVRFKIVRVEQAPAAAFEAARAAVRAVRGALPAWDRRCGGLQHSEATTQ